MLRLRWTNRWKAVNKVNGDERDFVPVGTRSGKRLVLLANLGTPDAPDAASVRRYLREFLSDPRVIEVPKVIWWCVLNGIILVFRPRRVAALYASIWEGDSPIRRIGYQLTEKLQGLVRAAGDDRTEVRMAMTYGQPSLRKELVGAVPDGYQEVVVLPLFPQYSATTTAAVFDQVADYLRSQRDLPAVRLIRDYHLHPRYIAALAAKVRAHWAAHGRTEKLLLSFHGLPQDYVDRGDPYQEECRATAEALAHALDLQDGEWALSFQSRFGPRAWLQPYTDKLLQQWGREQVASVAVLCPGFAVDCLETLEEIAVENRDVFLEAGGKAYSYIPALNDDDSHVALLHAVLDVQ